MYPDEPRESIRPASLILRAGAFLIDWAIVLLLAVFISQAAGSSIQTRLPILLTVASFYEVGFMLAMSTTPGKIALRMKVTDELGRPLEPDKAVLRSVAFLIGVMLAGIGLAIGALMALTDPMRRTLHDRLAGSIVVRL